MEENPVNKANRILALFLTLILVLGLCLPVLAVEQQGNVTILFTHDLHSQLLPMPQAGGGTRGGYARLMTLIQEQKKLDPDAILVDGGDFSMGSLFQTAYTTSAIELRMMGAMGYDVTTFGNHEFDYLPEGLAKMLNEAARHRTPAIVNGNYQQPESGALAEALENYGVKEYVLLERGGVYFAVFGVFGEDADACAPNSGMTFLDPVQNAQRIVDAARAECKEKYQAEPVVIALSHGGTEGGQGEDYELAKNVDGIHVIISGHTHTVLERPITVNGTYVVSAGEYGKNLGVVKLDHRSGKTELVSYELIPVTEEVSEDAEIADMVQDFKKTVETDYLSQYGLTFDQVLVNNPYTFDTVSQVYATAHESTLGNLFADAYKWAAEAALGGTVDFALTASGVIRDTVPVGDVTVSNVFNVASLGVGTEGELVAVYLTGKDLMAALEVDASVYPLMNSAQLFGSGIEYSYNTNRMIFNKVDYAMLRRADGSLEKIQKDQLYRVVTGMYMGQMLGSVAETSMGLLSIVPRDAAGDPINMSELVNYVVKDSDGKPVKEWFAIASYLQQMDGTMDADYAQTDGRKVVYSSLNPVKLLRNANAFTYAILAVIAVLLLAVVLVTRRVLRRKKR